MEEKQRCEGPAGNEELANPSSQTWDTGFKGSTWRNFLGTGNPQGSAGLQERLGGQRNNRGIKRIGPPSSREH